MEEQPLKWRINMNILNKLLQIADKWWSSSVGVRQGSKNCSLYKVDLVMKQIHMPWTWPDPLV